MPARDAFTTATARKLRHNQTDAERLLWSKLRARQLYGAKFRRQFPLPPFVADFCCEAAKLIVEVDGGQHAESREEDAARTRFFEEKGYAVVRFWNNEVLDNTDGVLEEIANRLPRAVPHPDPLPLGEGIERRRAKSIPSPSGRGSG